jgi:hypothetical protein
MAAELLNSLIASALCRCSDGTAPCRLRNGLFGSIIRSVLFKPAVGLFPEVLDDWILELAFLGSDWLEFATCFPIGGSSGEDAGFFATHSNFFGLNIDLSWGLFAGVSIGLRSWPRLCGGFLGSMEPNRFADSRTVKRRCVVGIWEFESFGDTLFLLVVWQSFGGAVSFTRTVLIVGYTLFIVVYPGRDAIRETVSSGRLERGLNVSLASEEKHLLPLALPVASFPDLDFDLGLVALSSLAAFGGRADAEEAESSAGRARFSAMAAYEESGDEDRGVGVVRMS